MDDIEARVTDLAERIAGLSCASVEKPALVYFDFIGIGWPIRAALHVADVDYELVQITIFEWMFQGPHGTSRLKSGMRNRHIPLYVDRDVRLDQSNAILAYLGEKHDLLGDDETERWAAMGVMAHAYDALFHWSGLFSVNAIVNTPEDVVAARRDAFLGEGERFGVLNDGYHDNLDAFVDYLEANPAQSGFIVGSRLSMADLHAFNVLCNWYKAFDRDRFTTEYPKLEDYVARLAAIPRVRDYIRKHQEETTWLPVPHAGLKLTTPEDLLGLTAAR